MLNMRNNRAYNEETRDKVLTIITLAGAKGISNREVAKMAEKDRNIVSAICKKLELSSLILVKTIGKRKIYHPTKEVLETPTFLDSIFFGNQLRTYLIRSKLFGFEMNLGELSKMQRRQIQYLKENLGNGELEFLPIHLQNFIFKIGTIITYILICAMSPEFTRKISIAQHVTEKISVDRFIQEWVKNVIFSMELLYEFRTIILESEFHPSSYYSKKKSHYELDEKLKKNSIEVLKQLYPEILRRLELVYNNLDHELKGEKDQWKQRECDHDFSSKILKGAQKHILEYNNRWRSSITKHEVTTEKGFREFYCKKCDLKIMQNLDFEITNKSLIRQLNNITSNLILKNNVKQSKNYKNRKSRIIEIKSPYVFKCKSNDHVWKKHSIPSQTLKSNSKFDEVYQCLLCHRSVNIEIIDRNIFLELRDSIINEVGQDKYTLQIGDTILDSFYKNQNKHYSLEDFKFPEYLNFRKRKSRSLLEFRNDRNKIIDIFVRYNIIKKDKSGKYYFINKAY